MIRYHFRPTVVAVLLAVVSSVVVGPVLAQTETEPPAPPAKQDQRDSDKSSSGWHPLISGNELSGWKKTNFGGEGPVSIKDGVVSLSAGSSLTGITYTGINAKTKKPVDPKFQLPLVNYEVRLQARRVDGTDFFCGLTFPYKKSHASLILGGWGGSICGISCLDYYDASENETTHYQKFDKGRWYKVRLRVTEEELDVWIDDKITITTRLAGRTVNVRAEVELSRPLGLASFDTTAEIKQLEIRTIKSGPSKP